MNLQAIIILIFGAAIVYPADCRRRRAMMCYLLLAALLSGCTYTVAGNDGPLAQCHDGALTSFCVVNVPKGAVVEGGIGLVPALGGSAIGSGAMMKAGGL